MTFIIIIFIYMHFLTTRSSFSEFLHRAADLTLVPSAAIAKDLEAARVTAGEFN